MSTPPTRRRGIGVARIVLAVVVALVVLGGGAAAVVGMLVAQRAATDPEGVGELLGIEAKAECGSSVRWDGPSPEPTPITLGEAVPYDNCDRQAIVTVTDARYGDPAFPPTFVIDPADGFLSFDVTWQTVGGHASGDLDSEFVLRDGSGARLVLVQVSDADARSLGDIPAGGSVTLTLQVEAPADSGPFTVELGDIDEFGYGYPTYAFTLAP